MSARSDGGSGEPELRRAVFLDRDGTLTVEAEWIRRGGDLVLVPGAVEALVELARAGFVLVMATNQSAVARGIVDEPELDAIHAHLESVFEEGGARLDAIYSCPHHPTEGFGRYKVVCECRKPKPGMLLQAARELGLDLEQSFLIGDAIRDLESGWNAGTRSVLVATGKGASEIAVLKSQGRAPDFFAPDVLAAARWVIAQGPRPRQGK